MTSDQALRDHVLYLLRGGGAHLSLDDALAGLPAELRGVKPPGVPHTAWRLLEHMRIAQWDILEFSRNPKHVSPSFPDGYWPKTAAAPDDAGWKKSVQAAQDDLRAMIELVSDSSLDLHAPF